MSAPGTKTRNTFYNSVAALAYYGLNILLGILNRQAVIAILGIEYQGVNGLFTNVLSMLSIAELGIGMAIVYHLYGALSRGDIPAVKSLMRFYGRCYTWIAAAILALGILVSPFLSFAVPDYSLSWNLWTVYAFFLLDAVISYLFTYKRSILIADQKNYVIVCCDILYQLAVRLGQILILALTGNFLLYLSLMVAGRLAENLLINAIAIRRYPYLKDRDAKPLSREILDDIVRKVKGAVFHKTALFFVWGTDSILLSRFFGLAMVGMYSNYNMILNPLAGICKQVLTAATASVGHLLAEGDQAHSRRVFGELRILNGGLITCCAAGFYCAADPFITLFFGAQYRIASFVLLSLTVRFYVQGMREVYAMFKEAAGILYEDRYIPLAESALNVGASLLLLHWFGAAGIFFGTAASSAILYVYTYPVLVCKNVLGIPYAAYYRDLFWLSGVSAAAIALSRFLCGLLFQAVSCGAAVQFLAGGLFAVLVSGGVYTVGYLIWKKESASLLRRVSPLAAALFGRGRR